MAAYHPFFLVIDIGRNTF